MATVTVAVPVYNGAALLEECLANLAAQDHRDLRILVLDNASTDATPDIAQAFARRDGRFEHHRQSTTKPILENFKDCLARADTPQFCWRAHDDLSSENFISSLLACLAAVPGAKLAACHIATANLDGSRRRDHPFPAVSGGKGARQTTLLRRSHASWMYGLFDTMALRAALAWAEATYGELWAIDHLTLLPFLLDASVVGTNGAVFHQRLKRTRDGTPRVRAPEPAAALMRERRARFLSACRAAIREREPPGLRRLWLDALAFHYTGRCVYGLVRTTRRSLQEVFRPAPSLSAGA